MDQELLKIAAAARDRAHAPYSDYAVGAAIRTADGQVHSGCNVENASYPEGWCAETSAIAAMVRQAPAGEGRRIEMVCVVADTIDGRIVTPCGGCRQRLAEFGTPETVIHAASPGGETARFTLAELLPAAFDLNAGADEGNGS